jgi:hypothetical protein
MRGPADKTAATVRMVLVAALRFMNDPAIAGCVLPGDDGEAFDIEEFLFRQGALYLIADQRSDISMILAAQGLAQIEDRWGKPAARSVLDTSNQLYVSGIQDPDTLKMASELCDIATYQVRGRKGETADYPVATPGMISSLPKRRALVLRGGMPKPVITHLPMVWHDRGYRWARLRRRTIADLYPAPASAAADVAAQAYRATWDAEPTDPVLAEAGAVNGHSANGHADAHPWDQP